MKHRKVYGELDGERVRSRKVASALTLANDRIAMLQSRLAYVEAQNQVDLRELADLLRTPWVRLGIALHLLSRRWRVR